MIWCYGIYRGFFGLDFQGQPDYRQSDEKSDEKSVNISTAVA